MSCDPLQRHKVLTFFFDGVPPLGGETAATEESPVLDANVPGPQTEQGLVEDKITWYSHNPGAGCQQCHKKAKGSRWVLPEFVKPVPELCYSGCHEDYTESGGLVHGPVVVGECLFCHDAHQSRNKNLLKESVPELCYLCHESQTVELIPGHSVETASECTKCHEAHTSSIKGLLKTDWEKKTD
ncbi:MAG: cytochrome c3 family protein [Planctomycetota bacterium]|jgi:predicted CXXCH cytochrome family protein